MPNLTVINGSGSGWYDTGKQITIHAYNPLPGFIFFKWTGDIDGLNAYLVKNHLTMPAHDLMLVASYIPIENGSLPVDAVEVKNTGLQPIALILDNHESPLYQGIGQVELGVSKSIVVEAHRLNKKQIINLVQLGTLEIYILSHDN